MILEERTLGRIESEFSVSHRESIVILLGSYSGPEPSRVIWDILTLSKGDPVQVKRFVEAARIDYRDILYWAEYYENDPMLSGQDPRKLG